MELIFSNILKGKERYYLKVFYLSTKEEFKIVVNDKEDKISIGEIINPMDIAHFINKMINDDNIKERDIALVSGSILNNYSTIEKDGRVKLFINISKRIGKGNMDIKINNNDIFIIQKINTRISIYEKELKSSIEKIRDKLIAKYGVPFGVNNIDTLENVIRKIISNMKANDINECNSRLLNIRKPKEFNKTKTLLRTIDRYYEKNFKEVNSLLDYNFSTTKKEEKLKLLLTKEERSK